MKIDNYYNSKNQIWLNVASSSDVLVDYVNLDNNIFLHALGLLDHFRWLVPRKYSSTIDSLVAAKKKALLVKHNCVKPLPLPDESVDHIVCSHFLEHVFPVEASAILTDFYRVLKPNATLHVIVPDLRRYVDDYLTRSNSFDPCAADVFMGETILSNVQRGSLTYRLLELHGGFGLQHRWMYDNSSLEKIVTNAGFELADKKDFPSLSYRLNDGSAHCFCRRILR